MRCAVAARRPVLLRPYLARDIRGEARKMPLVIFWLAMSWRAREANALSECQWTTDPMTSQMTRLLVGRLQVNASKAGNMEENVR